MAITITEDLVKGARWTRDKSGGKFVRIFLVGGLDPTNFENTYIATLPTTVDSVTGFQIPQYGYLFSPGSNIYCSRVYGEPFIDSSRTCVKVTVEYTSPEVALGSSYTIEISGSNSTKTLMRWPQGAKGAGDAILIGYNPTTPGQTFTIPIATSGLNTDPNANGGNYYDYASVPVISPNTVLTFTYLMAASSSNGPMSLSAKYRRRVSSAAWQNYPPGTWLCRTIDARSLVANTTYEIRASFEYDPDGWTRVEYFRNLNNGRVAPGVNPLDGTNNGYAIIPPYGSADFNQLGLPAVY